MWSMVADTVPTGHASWEADWVPGGADPAGAWATDGAVAEPAEGDGDDEGEEAEDAVPPVADGWVLPTPTAV
jgi:hypothetical protein